MSGRLIKNKGVKKGEVMKASEELLALGESNPQDTEKAKIKGEYLIRNDENITAPADPEMNLRARILSLSLFPNVYDKKYLMKHY